jgi:hypothetical protein
MVLPQKQIGRKMDQNIRPRHKPTYLQLNDLRQESPKHTMEEKQLLQQMLLRKLDIHMLKNKIRSLYFTLYQNPYQVLNMRPESVKQLQEVEGNIMEHIGIGNDFLSRTQKAQHLREIMNWDCIKPNNFCTAKGAVTRLKRQPTECEKIFQYGTNIHKLQETQKTQL